MSNWWNEVFENEGRYLWNDDFNDYSHEEELEIETKESTGAKCKYCGTRTGIHGFAFNREGKY